MNPRTSVVLQGLGNPAWKTGRAQWINFFFPSCFWGERTSQVIVILSDIRAKFNLNADHSSIRGIQHDANWWAGQ
jgi:hypothetical protein